MTDSAQLQGLVQLNRAFMQVYADLEKKGARRATRRVAKEVLLPDVLSSVPIDTGQLERSITVRSGKAITRRYGKGAVGAMVTTREGMFVGDTFYGGFQEFGWLHWKDHSYQNPQPYLRPALYDPANHVKAQQMFAAIIGEEVINAAKNARNRTLKTLGLD